MKKILIPLADGFEEIETMTIVDVLRRAECEVTVAGLKEGELTGSRKVRIRPDKTLEEALGSDYDMVVFPGGQPGADHLRADGRVLDLVRKADREKKQIGAICAAPLVLRDAGVIRGKKITSYPGMEREFEGCQYVRDRVVTDGHLTTSRGPGSALEFALRLVRILCGEEKVKELAQKMVLPC